MPRWTTYCARELAAALEATDYEDLAAKIDGGIGTLAIAAICARPPGPARDFELETWARRIAGFDETRLAFVIDPGTALSTVEAVVALDARVAELRGRPRMMEVFG